jgi:copper resistance protein B
MVSGATLALALALPFDCSSAETMDALMGMNDAAAVGKVMLDQLELEGGSGTTALAWDGQAWYGGDYDKAWVKTEGSPDPDNQVASRNELLWDHVLTRWWDLQTGLRYDLGHGPARGWAAVGLEGLAPYWFDVEASVYLGESGRTAAHLQVEHDLRLTRRLILQPEIETDLYGKSDAARDIRSGLSDLQIALRLRYEIRRELAPYAGVAWRRNLGTPGSLQWVAGFHVWL